MASWHRLLATIGLPTVRSSRICRFFRGLLRLGFRGIWESGWVAGWGPVRRRSMSGSTIGWERICLALISLRRGCISLTDRITFLRMIKLIIKFLVTGLSRVRIYVDIVWVFLIRLYSWNSREVMITFISTPLINSRLKVQHLRNLKIIQFRCCSGVAWSLDPILCKMISWIAIKIDGFKTDL